MALSGAELRDRLDPKHLTTDEMREEVEEQAKLVMPPARDEKQKDPEADPKAQREYIFDFEWKDPHGKVWKGKFTNKVPDIRTRQLVGALRAQLGNNLPAEALDLATQEINLVIAHMTFSLIKRPKWAEDLGALYDFQLLPAIYQEVANHEATFLGYGSLTAAG